MRYIEMNPVRANMVNNPSKYRWSSFRYNAQGIENKLVQPHPLYIQLGRTLKSRCEAYKALFRAHVEPEALRYIRAALQTGTPLGNDYFRDKIEKKLKTKVGQNRRGRPLKTASTP
jgi:putative transposase